MSFVSRLLKLKCPKCDEFNYHDIGCAVVHREEGCICWNCQYSFDADDNFMPAHDCDHGIRMVTSTDELLRDAASWRWLKQTVEKTGFIDFGANRLDHSGPGEGYEYCAPSQAKHYWSGTAWKPIGMASSDRTISRDYRRPKTS